MSDLGSLATTILTSSIAGASQFVGPQWGIFTSQGEPILAVDSVADIEYTRDYQISDYPQEEGAFASYNKVQQPYQAKLGFFINGARKDFLNTIEAAVKSLMFVVVVTPEIQYNNANLIHYGYRRTSRNGVSLIRVDIWCEEVRIVQGTVGTGSGEDTNAQQSTNAATPSSSGPTQTDPSGTNASGTGITFANQNNGLASSLSLSNVKPGGGITFADLNSNLNSGFSLANSPIAIPPPL